MSETVAVFLALIKVRVRTSCAVTTATLSLYLTGLFVIPLFGALLPFFKEWTDRQLHLFIAASAGIFLGVVFFHILPEVHTEKHGWFSYGLVLLGFLGMLLVERVIMGGGNETKNGISNHHIIGITAFIGLSIHSVIDGLGFSLVASEKHLAMAVFLAIVSHKMVASFSLATVFRLSRYRPSRSIGLLLFYAGITPVVVVLSRSAFGSFPQEAMHIPAAFAGGVFLYIATCDLLPEAFHESRRHTDSFIAVASGIALMFFLMFVLS